MGSSYARLFVHLVWATKLREPWIVSSVAPRLHALIATRCDSMNCVAIAVGGVEDHVHVLVGLHPSVAVADLTRDLKATSSTFMRRTYGQPKFEWQEGYGAFSLRDTELEVTRRNIRDQSAHHAAGDVIDEWERVSPPKAIHRFAMPESPPANRRIEETSSVGRAHAVVCCLTRPHPRDVAHERRTCPARRS